MIGRKDWKIVERRLEIALETASGIEAEIGTLILERLRTYGEFYDRLSNDRDLDLEIAARLAEGAEPPVLATTASCQLGSLLLTARTPGGAGNSIVATVSPGTATGFAVQGVDPKESQAQLNATVSALNGAPPVLSSDPAIAAVQQMAADFLANLTPAARAGAEKMVRENWDRYRVARTISDLEYDKNRAVAALNQNMSSVAAETDRAVQGVLATASPEQAALVNRHISQEVSGAFDGSLLDLQEADYDADSLAQNPGARFVAGTITDSYQTMIEQHRAGVSNTFTLKLTNGDVVESYNDIVSGFSYSFNESILVGTSVWTGSTRPADGDHRFSGGTDAEPASTGLTGAKPASAYVIYLDAKRKFTLPEVEEIVVKTLESAVKWLV